MKMDTPPSSEPPETAKRSRPDSTKSVWSLFKSFAFWSPTTESTTPSANLQPLKSTPSSSKATPETFTATPTLSKDTDTSSATSAISSNPALSLSSPTSSNSTDMLSPSKATISSLEATSSSKATPSQASPSQAMLSPPKATPSPSKATPTSPKLTSSSSEKNPSKSSKRKSKHSKVKNEAPSQPSPIITYPGGIQPPDFGVILYEDENSTPEKRSYTLNSENLLAKERWGVQQTTISQVDHTQPLPWIEQKYHVFDQYVNIEIELLDRSGQRPKRMVPSLRNLFDALETEGKDNRPKHLMFRGEAGSGKSTFCKYLTYCWTKNHELIDRLEFSRAIIVYYDLRDLKPDDELDLVILEKIHLHGDLGQDALQLTEKCLHYYQGETVLILDGYDALNDKMKEKVKVLLKVTGGKNTVFRRGTFCIISRFETDREILYLFDRQFKLKGFTKENVEVFLSKHFGEEEMPVLKARFDKYKLARDFDFVGLAPVTILLVAQHLQDPDEPDGQYELIFRVIMSLARRCIEIDHFSFNEAQIKQKLFHLGEWFRICSVVGETGFTALEFQKYMSDDHYFIIRCGIIQRRLCPPLGGEGLLEAQHIMYWKVIESFYIQEKWLSLTTDEERANFLDHFELEDKAIVCMFILRLSSCETKVYVRIYGGNAAVCFKWKIVRGSIATFQVIFEGSKEFQPENESLGINCEFKETTDSNAAILIGCLHKLISISRKSEACEKIQDLLRNFRRRSIHVSYVDGTQRKSASVESGTGEKRLEDDANRNQILPFEDVSLTSTLWDTADNIQISLHHSWASVKNFNSVIKQMFQLELGSEHRDELIHEYLHGLMIGLRKVSNAFTLIFKFTNASQKLNLILKPQVGQMLVNEYVYCTEIHKFTADEVLRNSELVLSLFKWGRCYQIIIMISR